MPRGEPNAQTVASAKYHKKAGYRHKTFMLKGDVGDRFAAACERAGRSQASVIAELMEKFIREAGATDGEG